eukprot:CCRYP_016363-RA/>CCRYP_016363-RA protein AED:0.02 eAED:0.02 QI:331/1/1/1/0.66/0.5/4/1447/881
MTPHFPPHHINSVSINSLGWVVPSARVNADDLTSDDIALTKSCREFLSLIKVDLLDDSFTRESRSLDAPENVSKDACTVALEDLPHSPNLCPKIVKVIADIRKMGDTNDGETAGSRRRKQHHGKKAKAAQLEEQRSMRRQKEEQEELKQTQLKRREELADVEMGFLPVGNVPSITDEISPDARLAMTFNSLRVLVTVLRPAIDHPRRQDLGLKMKRGPCIHKSGKSQRFYLFLDRVYSCTTVGAWKEVSLHFRCLFEDMGLSLGKVMKRNKEGRFEFDLLDWIASVVECGDCLHCDIVVKKCFELTPKNDTVISKLHEALMSRFDYAHDNKQIVLQRSIRDLQIKLSNAISQKFPGARLTVYGSCLSGLALEGSHDVDVSVYIPGLHALKRQFDCGQISGEVYEKKMRRIIFMVRDSLTLSKCRSFVEVFAITHARVPVIKGADQNSENPFSSGFLNFDLCFLNDIAVVNSSLLREYSLFDKRVRVLMLCVKSFAKSHGVSSAAEMTLSSYSWLNLVVFYLQCIKFLPVLQCPKLLAQHNFIPDRKGNPWHSINSLETYFLPSELVLHANIWKQLSRFSDTTIPELLYGFFSFYLNVFPRESVAASIRFGDCSLHKASFHKSSRLWRLSIEDPFETFESHCPHDLGSHLNEKGQKKVTTCFSTGLHTLHVLMEGESNDVKVVTESLFNFIGCAANKPQEQAPKGRGKNQKTSPPVPRPEFIDRVYDHSVVSSKDVVHPPPLPANIARQNKAEQQNHARNSRSFVGAIVGRGGAGKHDAYRKVARAGNHRSNDKQHKNSNYRNKTLDAINQVATFANDNRLRQHPNSKHRGDRVHKVNGMNSENRRTSNGQHGSNIAKNEHGRQDASTSSCKDPTHNNSKQQ